MIVLQLIKSNFSYITTETNVTIYSHHYSSYAVIIIVTMSHHYNSYAVIITIAKQSSLHSYAVIIT